MCEVYRVFAKDYEHFCDFSDESKVELFNHESYGTEVNKYNGFYVGKRWLNVSVKMWKEDVSKGMLMVWELYEDEKFPNWWLDSVFKSELNKGDNHVERN